VPITEHTINDAIARALIKTRHAWATPKTVYAEHTGMFKGGNRRADILIVEPNVSPVAIETEVLPAITVEEDAKTRLGQVVRTTGRPILSSIAVRLPSRLRNSEKHLGTAADLEMAMFTGSSPEKAERWPRKGWITGGIADLSVLTQSASVPPHVIEKASKQLTDGVNEAAGLLEEVIRTRPSIIREISNELRQGDNGAEQIRRVVATIFANALIFQESLSSGEGQLAEIRSLCELRAEKLFILKEWEAILRINYYPIFDIASRVLRTIPSQNITSFLASLINTADALSSQGVMRSHDLTGRVFQRVITDRRLLAANYTDPASAALLVGLAITPERPSAGKAWVNATDVTALRVADFACGTGTLLSTAYQRIGQLHELSGGNAAVLHPKMIAHSLIGTDVLPAATHLTATMLSGAHPTVTYTQSSIMTIPFGRRPYGIALGSLDLLKDQIDFTETVNVIEGMGERERETWLALPNARFDFVVMNPPFTRNTDHKRNKTGITHPMFAAFGSTKLDQREMAAATKRLIKSTGAASAHGNAGEASIFLVLADRKLEQGGTLGLVMPFSLMLGDSWSESRKLLAKRYSDLILVSIAGKRDRDMSFSADTDMGECLVIGRKGHTGTKRATFVILKNRPAYTIEGACAAEQIRLLVSANRLNRLEDGPVGGTPVFFGEDLIGHAIDAPLPNLGAGWNVARIEDLSLAQSAYQLVAEKRIWLPRMRKSEAVSIPVTTISEIANVGPYHLDIRADTASGGIRGPFDIQALSGSRKAPTYPALWAHDANRERTMLFAADCEACPRHGRNDEERAFIARKAAEIWRTASHCHFNTDFRFNSQSTGMQFTPHKTIGGRAWLSLQLASQEQEKALVVWANTSFGMLLHWWHSNKQQAGRGSIVKSVLYTLPVLNVTALSIEQLSAAVRIFDTMCNRELLPLNEIDNDSARHELDAEFAQTVLNLPRALVEFDGPLYSLREKLAEEPSIRGSKEGSTAAKPMKKPVASARDLYDKQIVLKFHA